MVVTSGGALEFTDNSVVLSKYDFNTATSSAGTIQVDASSTNGGSIFKGKTVVIEHALASNASTAKKPFATGASPSLNDDLTELTNTAGIYIEADVLKLGSNSLIQEQSAEIKFAKATVKNEIDFSIKSGDYQLATEIVGNNFMRTQNLDSDLDYYTALNGTINGDVEIITGGKLNIEYGHWTANDSVTLSKTGELSVGGNPLEMPEGNTSTSIADATLTLDNLTLSVGNVTDASTINVTGNENSLYKYDEAAETIGDDGLVLLDLSNGLSIETNQGTINGKSTITVTSGGIVKLNASDLNDILAANNATGVQSTSGSFLQAYNHGVFEVSGDIEATFSDFGDGTNHGISLGGLTLSGPSTPSTNGYLVADRLSVLAQNDANASDADKDDSQRNKILNLGHATGTVDVKHLVISDLQLTIGTKPSGSNDYASKVTFGQGTAYISESLTSNNHTLHLGDTSGATKAHINLETGFADGEGKVNVTNISIDSGSFNVLGGSWDASSTTFKLSGSNSILQISGSETDANDVDFTPSLVASGVVMDAGSVLAIGAKGTASFDNADFSNLAAANSVGVHVAGTLIINGSETATTSDGEDDPKNGVAFGAEGSIVIANNGILKFGSLATNGAILADGSYSGSGSVTSALDTDYSKIENQGGELHLGFTSSTTFDGEAIKALKQSLFTSNSFNGDVLAYGGILNIGDATFNGIEVDELEGPGLSGYTATWEDLQGFSDIYGSDVTNNKLVQTNVSAVKAGDQILGHWGSLSLDTNTASSAQATLAGNVTLRYAAGNNGFFISNAEHSEARGAIVEGQKDLTFIGGGVAGKITLKEGIYDAEKNLTIFKIMDGDTTVSAIEGRATSSSDYADATVVEALSNLTVTNDIEKIDEVSALNGSTIKAANAEVNEFNTELSHIAITKELKFNYGDVVGGSVSAEDAFLQDSGEKKLAIAHGGIFKANTLTVENGGEINVGFDSTNESYTLDNGTKVLGTGYFEVGTLETNGATITVDPAYGEKTSVSTALRFKEGKETYAYNGVGTLNGEIHVGANSVFAVGANVADTLEAVATYQSDGSLSKDKYGSILYLNGQMIVMESSEIALNSDDSLASDIRDSLKYTVTSQELDQYADLGLGTNTAVLVTENAFEDSNGDKTGTAIYFDRKAAVVNGAGGEIVLAGTFDASDKLNIFNDKDNDGVDIKGAIKVLTQNGFLYATLSGNDAGKGVQLEVDKNKAYAVMSEASTPVIESLISYHADRIATNSNDTEESEQDDIVPATELVAANTVTKAGATVDNSNGDSSSNPSQGEDGNGSGTGSNGSQTQTPPVATTKVNGNSSFLNEVVNTSHGAPAEAAARLAIYGGAVQSVLAANNSSAELISSRMGVGAQNGALTFADNGQGAGLWVAPLYKSQESDSLGAQGLNYGVDLSMTGLALGGDYTLGNGMRFGAMFNVGSGDADGQGNVAAASTTNDFDYWGLSVYGGYTVDALSIVADLGYTVVDNSLEATTGMQSVTKLTASTESSALTFGVTGQYKFDFNGLAVAPHAGLRYTNVDLDSYTVKGNVDVAHYNADSMSVFSIPVGVTLSKDFVAGSWTVKPSVDLTLTANMGDDSIDGSVTWTEVNNLQTNVESEVMDSFTYGATFGVAAKTGNFSLGLGLNYTGASNTDEYGVNANVRFVF